jgi:hypothetical protein
MTDAPERIGLIRGPFGGWRLWDNTSSHEEADARYIRADAPPTLAEAMRCEEVRALVDCVSKGPILGQHMRHWIEDMMKQAAELANLKGPTP